MRPRPQAPRVKTLERRCLTAAAAAWLAGAALLPACSHRGGGPGDLAGTRPEAAAAEGPPDIVVAADGSGDFRSLQAALQSIPPDNAQRRVVQLRAGEYRERARLDAPYVTLRGAGPGRTRLVGSHPGSAAPDALGRGVLDLGPRAHDAVIEQLTVHNTHPVRGEHAFAIFGRADRTVIQDCEVLGLGNDTLALWRGAAESGAAPERPAHGGRYYHARLRVTGSVDFVCPRGWCYLVDSTLEQVNEGATASMWHDGSGNADKKFVLRRCRFDGPPGWVLARRHRDAHLIFIDCRFSAAMRDLAPYRVRYPEGHPSAAVPDLYGDRFHFHHCRRDGGDYAWHGDNLHLMAARPQPAQIDARWTFGGSWDPERSIGPALVELLPRRGGFELVFDEAVTARGQPRLRLADGRQALLEGAVDSRRLAWRTEGSSPTAAELAALRLDAGAVLALQASTRPRPVQWQRHA